jgi:hypothetical protein
VEPFSAAVSVGHQQVRPALLLPVRLVRLALPVLLAPLVLPPLSQYVLA